MTRYNRIRLSWLAVFLWCAVAVTSRSVVLVASAGVAIVAWSMSLALNRFEMIDELQARGRQRPEFDQPRRSYVVMGSVGVFIGTVWFVAALTHLV